MSTCQKENINSINNQNEDKTESNVDKKAIEAPKD